MSKDAGTLTAYAEDLIPGARNAVRTCLRVRSGENVAIVTDRETEEIAASLADQVREANGAAEILVMEDYGPRPMLSLPAAIAAALERADVSIYAGQPKQGELAFRRDLTQIVDRRQIRHAHMVSISHRIMTEAMRANFDEVDAISKRVLDRAIPTKKILATSPGGSRLEATFDPSIKWLKTSGIISTSKWGNLPGGEVLTAPARVDGLYVADGVVGDYLCARYGDLRANPLSVWIENSRITDVRCDRQDLVDDFLKYTSTDENSNRVGEFAIGTNIAVHNLIGNILQDEKLPTLHIAFGHPYTEHTGANWRSTTHIDIVGRDFDIWFDGDQIMEKGKFLI
ncbi:MAG TPA: aminopeptidase [Thermoanaerobaculia bacterium]|jgi:leucyl aminopeptidase (aminopeptidase T)|nr:aminopeptidase [Thermoanaerobaculia bacterium]